MIQNSIKIEILHFKILICNFPATIMHFLNCENTSFFKKAWQGILKILLDFLNYKVETSDVWNDSTCLAALTNQYKIIIKSICSWHEFALH